MEIFGKLLIFALLLIAMTLSAYPQEYAINTYGDESIDGLREIKTAFINLNSKAIVSEISYGQGGLILNKTSLNIIRGHRTRLINASREGCVCTNASADQPYQTRITIIDPQTKMLESSLADSGMAFIYFEQGPNGSVFIDANSFEGLHRRMCGDYILYGNFRLLLRTQRPLGYNPKSIHGLGRFSFFTPISHEEKLYMSWQAEDRFVLKLSNSMDAIIDSLKLTNSPRRTQLVATFDNLLYVFNQNYEFYGETTWKGPEDNRISSYLLIYNIDDLSLADSLYIPDYPPGDYIGGEFGVADVVGPYIVYYYFIGDGIPQFAPAMLFIFDTRTNEAAWLRVGWR